MKYRLKIEVREYSLAESNATQIQTPEVLFEALRDDFNPMQEEVYLLVMDYKNRIIDKILVAKGSGNMIIIRPIDILPQFLMLGGKHAVLAHNHPSGELLPSEDDIAMTRRMNQGFKAIGAELLDHIIYSPEGFYSFKKHGLI